MKFADHHPGQVIEAGQVSVSADEIVRFAAAWDPQTMHTDPDAAAHGRFGLRTIVPPHAAAGHRAMLASPPARGGAANEGTRP